MAFLGTETFKIPFWLSSANHLTAGKQNPLCCSDNRGKAGNKEFHP